MSEYVISDIHGEYGKFMELLEKIKLGDTDTLYVLGDILDRGPEPIRVIHKLMEMPNAICLVGNHELMALDFLEFLMKEITADTVNDLDDRVFDNLMTWEANGCRSTINEISKLNMEQKQDIVDFIKDFSLYEEITVNDKDYLLVHAGLGHFSPEKDIEDYSLKELVWERADYDRKYFEDKIVISGHTPTQIIPGNPNPGYIYRKNNHIAIDCGACFPGGRLSAICLQTGEEFYSSANNVS